MLKAAERRAYVAYALIGTLVVVSSLAWAPPADAAVNTVKVDGKTVYSSAKSTTLQAVKGVKYSPSKKTLTLSNMRLRTEADAGISIDATPSDNVTIKLKGSNSISVLNPEAYGIRAKCRLALKGTKINVTSAAVGLSACAVTFGGGSFSFKKCAQAGVLAAEGVAISAGASGTVSATTLKPQQSMAIGASAGTVSNPAHRLGPIAGKMGSGAQFVHAGSSYTVLNADSVRLQEYAGGKRANLNSVKFGKCVYDIAEVAPSAFDNRTGRKVTSIVLGANTRKIGRDAFRGTNLLTNLNLKDFLCNVDILNWKPLLESAITGIDSKAFRGCGMLSGAKLNVHTSFKNKDVNLGVKAALTLKGLPVLAKVKK